MDIAFSAASPCFSLAITFAFCNSLVYLCTLGPFKTRGDLKHELIVFAVRYNNSLVCKQMKTFPPLLCSLHSQQIFLLLFRMCLQQNTARCFEFNNFRIKEPALYIPGHKLTARARSGHMKDACLFLA